MQVHLTISMKQKQNPRIISFNFWTISLYMDFLTYIFPKAPPPQLGAQLCPVVGGWLELLETAVSGTGQPWPLLAETPAAPTASSWICGTNIILNSRQPCHFSFLYSCFISFFIFSDCHRYWFYMVKPFFHCVLNRWVFPLTGISLRWEMQAE